ncbi:MAG TPA: glutamate-5-semialdehyde dehydrogenase, partial [Rhizobiales bacterium]|nr:glutamate-5-semialdehyde dehydrogenase [Hyphomicrobiales bacterium]
MDTSQTMQEMGIAARAAAKQLALAPSEKKNRALHTMARAVRAHEKEILNANRIDVAEASKRGQRASFIDRLTLTPERIEAMAKGLEDIAALGDPVGEVIGHWQQPNGLDFSRVRVPIGVIGIIYESRPNVTADAGALCMKSGNAAILRGGSDGINSSREIVRCLQTGLASAGLPEKAIQMVDSTDRACVGEMLSGLDGNIDLIVPRGGKSLVGRVQTEARVPVFAHLEGLCHVYIDKDADVDMAVKVTLNAKMRRTGICGAAETVLIDRAGAGHLLKPVIDALVEAGCEIRGGPVAAAADNRVKPASEQDWTTEYL